MKKNKNTTARNCHYFSAQFLMANLFKFREPDSQNLLLTKANFPSSAASYLLNKLTS